MKNTVCLILALLLIVFTSCGSVANHEAIDPEFSSVEFNVTKHVNDDLIVYSFAGAPFPISLALFNESERTFLVVDDEHWRSIGVDWRPGDAIENMYMFKREQQYFFMFPTFTEEFETYQIIQFDKDGHFLNLGIHTYSFEDFVTGAEKMRTGGYGIRTIHDTMRVVHQSDPEMVLSEIRFDEYAEDAVTKDDLERFSEFKSARKESSGKEDENVLLSYSVAIDKDAYGDRIFVYRNESLEDQFDRDHFGLKVEIFRGTKDGLDFWTKNEGLIFPVIGSCVSEGFEGVNVEDNRIIFYQQTCREYNILIHSTVTFEVQDDQIVLLEYQEEYFNKVDHEEDIPTKIWTSADFDKVKFEEVTSNFWRELRGY